MNNGISNIYFEQTKKGAYSSIPEVKHVLEGLGIEPGKNIFKYSQTIGGAFDSKPEPIDIFYLLNENWEKWNEIFQSAYDDGHGEYVDNVEYAVEYCKENNITDIEGIINMLNEAEEDISWDEYALNRGHGEYVKNTNKAIELCKELGCKTRGEVENVLNGIKIKEV